MLDALRRRLSKDENGFTLIELMVVVLIIAILIAIAIPTFLGAQDRARDRGAQSDLRNALTAAKTLATDNAGKFFAPDGTTPIESVAMEDAEPSLAYNDAAASDTEVMVTTNATGTVITLSKESASGAEFGISATSDGEVSYCKVDPADGSCGDAEAAGTWTSKW